MSRRCRSGRGADAWDTRGEAQGGARQHNGSEESASACGLFSAARAASSALRKTPPPPWKWRRPSPTSRALSRWRGADRWREVYDAFRGEVPPTSTSQGRCHRWAAEAIASPLLEQWAKSASSRNGPAQAAPALQVLAARLGARRRVALVRRSARTVVTYLAIWQMERSRCAFFLFGPRRSSTAAPTAARKVRLDGQTSPTAAVRGPAAASTDRHRGSARSGIGDGTRPSGRPRHSRPWPARPGSRDDHNERHHGAAQGGLLPHAALSGTCGFELARRLTARGRHLDAADWAGPAAVDAPSDAHTRAIVASGALERRGFRAAREDQVARVHLRPRSR